MMGRPTRHLGATRQQKNKLLPSISALIQEPDRQLYTVIFTVTEHHPENKSLFIPLKSSLYNI